MYHITGGGYGGNARTDGLSYGCSTIGISKSAPLEVMEQQYPILFQEYALREDSGGAGRHRGGMGLRYAVTLRRGVANASFVMDHGRYGPQGVLGGADGAPNRISIRYRDGRCETPPHLSKAQNIRITEGDTIHIETPGGGGYGDPEKRDPELVRRDERRGYVSKRQ
jgi:N-methylhydantoinase B